MQTGSLSTYCSILSIKSWWLKAACCTCHCSLNTGCVIGRICNSQGAVISEHRRCLRMSLQHGREVSVCLAESDAEAHVVLPLVLELRRDSHCKYLAGDVKDLFAWCLDPSSV